MSITEINARIKELNAEVHKRNEERQILIGKKQALENQLNELIEKYKQDTGVDLNVVGIEAELNRVVTEKTAQITKLENMIGLIDSGQYAEAEKIIGISEVVEKAETPVSVVKTVAETGAGAIPVVNPLAEFNMVSEPKSEPVSKQINEPVAVSKPISKSVVDDEVAPAPPNMDGVGAPPSIGEPKPAKPTQPINSFGAILGGSAFLGGGN